MIRKAFTLIELLVVIAIISILAAILFPVFAQAKVAAKKAVGISNQKQISLAMIMYTNDYDDLYPRNDDCAPFSSLNPVLNSNPWNPNGAGCRTFPFYYRRNHFSWQKWIMPYVKNVQVFEDGLRQKQQDNWNQNGQLVYGLVLNSAVTGSLDVYARSATFKRQFRDSWIGGSQLSVPDPAQANLLLTMPLTPEAVLPGASDDSVTAGVHVKVWPLAIREFWQYRLMKGTADDCVNRREGTVPDAQKMPAQGILVGFCDGHAKFLPAAQFLALTPPKEQYIPGSSSADSFSGWTFPATMECDFTKTTGNVGFSAEPNTTIDYPLWALGAQP